uniref:Peptidase S1 domain-containing protein n=1 Tax=Meloidogyne floridensis TaxID=298350 RepID=A0A915P551_9BILA
MFFDILHPKIFFLFLFFYFQFLNFVNGILAGEEIDWNRNGFVVKVLAREGPNAPTKSCTGSLISASLVLTSGDCVVDRSTKESLNEFVVFVSKPSDKELRSTGKLLERNEQNGWALLRIAPQNITELCPPSPAPKWVARLNFRPLLTSGPRLEVSQADLSSGEGAVSEDFLNENRLLRIYLDKLEKPPKDDGLNQYRSDVYSGFTACYDDTGAPLLCKLSKYQDPALQLGIFQSLTVPGGKTAKDDEPNDKSNKTIDELNKCKLATQMRFNLFNADESLAKAIEKYALTEFVSVYHECGF